ncbi:MAG: SIS domain-containing protein, partial [Thioalkalispiraceae bacterium]
MRYIPNALRPLAQQLRHFIDHYRNTVINYLESQISAETLTQLSTLITNTIKAGGSIYVCGNGGSHAIARQFESSLVEALADGDFPVRVRWGVDFHASQSIVRRYGYDQIFKQLLSQEHAGTSDLVVLVSGSGNSTNVLVAADYCRKHGIPAVGIAAFHGGQLCEKDIVDLSIAIDIDDQQIGEDVVQSVLQIAAWHAAILLKDQDPGLELIRHQYLTLLAEGYNQFDAEMLTRVGATVSDAYHNGRRVYVLAPEGGGVSLSAEHVAHNLNWDAVYEVRLPPPRYLTSTPSGCDFSGIGNDRFLSGVVSCQQLSMAVPGDILIVFAVNLQESAVQETMNYARTLRMELFCIAGDGQNHGNCNMMFNVDHRSVVADLCQTAGHMLGRIVRLTLKIHEDGSAPYDDLLSYLVE